MKTHTMIALLSALALTILLLAGCSEDIQTVETGSAGSSGSAPAEDTTASGGDSGGDSLKSLEITPSGDDKCFLSPCDCNCYPVKNVPLTARKATCAINCREVYGVTGCRFTNYQCVTLE